MYIRISFFFCSKEIIRDDSFRGHFFLPRLFVDRELFFPRRTNREYRGHIPAPIAIIRRRPHRDERPVELLLVPLLDELVRPAYEVDPVVPIELVHDLRPEEDADAPLRHAPRRDAVAGVRPQQVAHGALVGDLLDAVELPDAVERRGPGRQAPVDAEDAPVDQRRDGQRVEEVGQQVPDAQAAELADALVVQPVRLGHGAALVVPPEQRHAVGVAHLQGEQQQDRLDAVVPPVDVVAQEEVARLGRLAPDLEELEKVVELAVDVAADGYREIHPENVLFGLGDLSDFLAE